MSTSPGDPHHPSCADVGIAKALDMGTPSRGLATVQPGRVSPEGLPVFTVDELAQYDGRQPGGLLYLAVLGEVFDVTSGAQHYQEGTGYHCFVGRCVPRCRHALLLPFSVRDVCSTSSGPLQSFHFMVLPLCSSTCTPN